MTNATAGKFSSSRRMNKGFHQRFLDLLAEMYDAEGQLIVALPLVATAAHSPDLKQLLHAHLKETQGHLRCIQHAAKSLGDKLPKKTSPVMKELITATVEVIVAAGDSPFRDIALIAAAQKIEHYEIASYRTLCAWARQMGHTHEVALLSSTLGQEKLADALLTGLAKGSVPLAELVKQVSLQQVAATAPPVPGQ